MGHCSSQKQHLCWGNPECCSWLLAVMRAARTVNWRGRRPGWRTAFIPQSLTFKIFSPLRNRQMTYYFVTLQFELQCLSSLRQRDEETTCMTLDMTSHSYCLLFLCCTALFTNPIGFIVCWLHCFPPACWFFFFPELFLWLLILNYIQCFSLVSVRAALAVLFCSWLLW